jgi:hypothetical protein
MSVAITEAITTLAEAEQRFTLTRSDDEQFFWEWFTDLPQLTEAEQNRPNRAAPSLSLSTLRRAFVRRHHYPPVCLAR